MDIKSKKMKIDIKGIRGWFVLAVLAVDLCLTTSLAGSGDFVADVLLYVSMIILLLSCLMLMVKLKADSREFTFFGLLDKYHMDTLLAMECIVAAGIFCLVAWVGQFYWSWVWESYGLNRLLYSIVVFIMLLPGACAAVLCYVIFIRRCKDQEKRRTWWIVSRLPRKKVKEKKFVLRKNGLSDVWYDDAGR